MQIGIIKRLHVTYAFWRALGAKNHNTVMAVVHECGFVKVSSGCLDAEVVETVDSDSELNSESNSVGGYDGHRTA